MSKAFRIYETGGPEVMRWEDVEVGDPGPGQVRLRHAAVGINFRDLLVRRGVHAVKSFPSGIGIESAGVIDAVGPGVVGLSLRWTRNQSNSQRFQCCDMAGNSWYGRKENFNRPTALLSKLMRVQVFSLTSHPVAQMICLQSTFWPAFSYLPGPGQSRPRHPPRSGCSLPRPSRVRDLFWRP